MNYLLLYYSLELANRENEIQKIAFDLDESDCHYKNAKYVISMFKERGRKNPEYSILENLITYILFDKEIYGSIYYFPLKELLNNYVQKTHNYKKMIEDLTN